MTLELSSAVHDALLAEAAGENPRECCGILFGSTVRIDGYSPADNVHATPQTHFEIDPAALIAAHRAVRHGGPRIAGFYHSHPNGRRSPSPTDAAQASGEGMVWAIIARNAVSLWRDEGDFKSLPYRLVKP